VTLILSPFCRSWSLSAPGSTSQIFLGGCEVLNVVQEQDLNGVENQVNPRAEDWLDRDVPVPGVVVVRKDVDIEVLGNRVHDVPNALFQHAALELIDIMWAAAG
jgi:hypothetical protein